MFQTLPTPLRRGGFVLAAALLLIAPSLLDAGLFHGRRAVPCYPVVECVPVAPQDAIRAVLDQQVIAWNKGDLEGFMRGYWASPELSFFSGKDKTHGWQATLERYQKKYRADGKEMGQLTFRELDIDVLGPDSAFVRGRWHLKMSKDELGELGGLFTLIFKRFPEGWRIVHDHTSG
jgi:ketosteroid isomerase-like protein